MRNVPAASPRALPASIGRAHLRRPSDHQMPSVTAPAGGAPAPSTKTSAGGAPAPIIAGRDAQRLAW